MFPISDSVKSKKIPFITIFIVVLNIFVFAQMLLGGTEQFIAQYALVPSQVNFLEVRSLLQFVTSIFLHGGFFHIFSNMWFLWVFGDNVEERIGRIKYLSLFLATGIAGALLQYILNFDSLVPMIGASGAVSGVLGAYYVLFPRHTVRSLIFAFFVITTMNVPATFYILYWFVIQLFSGVASLPSISAQSGGVAFFAHIGGFITGLLLTKYVFARAKKSWIEGELIT